MLETDPLYWGIPLYCWSPTLLVTDFYNYMGCFYFKQYGWLGVDMVLFLYIIQWYNNNVRLDCFGNIWDGGRVDWKYVKKMK